VFVVSPYFDHDAFMHHTMHVLNCRSWPVFRCGGALLFILSCSVIRWPFSSLSLRPLTWNVDAYITRLDSGYLYSALYRTSQKRCKQISLHKISVGRICCGIHSCSV